jgi:coenzyme F420-0:L-glutamate ligase / coenzyme F420-1:gamma-L-glutamate ligase
MGALIRMAREGTSAIQELRAIALAGLPLFAPGMDVAAEVAAAAARQGEALRRGDVVVVAQKIVSKAEGRYATLGDVHVSEAATRMADATHRPAPVVQLILDESSAVLRATPAAIITCHHSGHVLANAGIDASNVEGGDIGQVLLWPRDPDESARTIRAGLATALGATAVPAVVIADSMGRAWRVGTLGTAIGCAGLTVLDDQRGQVDLFGRSLQATIIAVADAIAGLAVLVMGEGAEATPAAIVRGAGRWVTAGDGPGATSGLRPVTEDMFR